MSRWRPPQKAGSPYITPGGYAALESEVETLWQRRREVVEHLAAAAAEGDRSENAEYIYRKKQLGELDRRIRYLQRRMPKLEVVHQQPAATDRVYFSACVTVETAAGEEQRYRIVGTDEIAPEAGAISVDSPLARALLGKTVDDEVQVRTEAGATRYLILGIDYPAGG